MINDHHKQRRALLNQFQSSTDSFRGKLSRMNCDIFLHKYNFGTFPRGVLGTVTPQHHASRSLIPINPKRKMVSQSTLRIKGSAWMEYSIESRKTLIETQIDRKKKRSPEIVKLEGRRSYLLLRRGVICVVR